MFYDILSETLDLDKYLNDRTKYHDVIKKFSFENKFIDQKYSDTGKALDSVSFKFFDYVYSCTKQQQPDEEKNYLVIGHIEFHKCFLFKKDSYGY